MYKISDFQTLLFDLGGVIINLNYQATIDAFEKLGAQDFAAHFSKATQSSFFADFEKGRKGKSDFIAFIQSFLPNATHQEILDAWNVMLLDIPKERLELLAHLKKQLPLYMLSNNNEVHYDYMNNYLEKDFGLPNLNQYFNKIYVSHEIDARKPDANAWEHVIKDSGIKPSTTLFIDDSPQHIETAKSLGFHTHQLTAGEDILELFSF